MSDDGVGFPQDVDFRATQSLGLEIVLAKVAALGGTITLNRQGGTTFMITFVVEKESSNL